MDPARTMDALVRVVRAFQAPDVFHPLGDVDPERDLRKIEAEWLVADYTLVQTRLERIASAHTRRKADTQAEQEKKILERCSDWLEAENPLRTLGLTDAEKKTVSSLGFLTLKPVVTVLNTDTDTAETEARWGALIAEFAERGETILAANAAMEAEIAELPQEDRAEFMAGLGIERPASHRLSRAAFEALGLISFFTVGPDEVRAWPLRRGSTAPAAAGVIHSDLERGFIRAEVIPYTELVEAGSEKAARQAKRFTLKGKDYVVNDGDVLEIRFSV
jgi:GTP-binding protein YchF